MLVYLGVIEKHTGKGYSVSHGNTAFILKHKVFSSYHFINKYFGSEFVLKLFRSAEIPHRTQKLRCQKETL